MFKRAVFVGLCSALLFLMTLWVTTLRVSSVYADDDLPDYSGWVNDFAGVLSDEHKGRIASLIEKLEKETSAEVAVAVVDSLRFYDDATYANLLFEKWKIGKKGKDNGLLLLLAVKERKVRIETGYGLEGILPDGLCGEILDSYVVPHLRNGEYSEGLYRGVVAISNVIEGKYDGSAAASASQDKPLNGVAAFFILISLVNLVSGNWAAGVSILLFMGSIILFMFGLILWGVVSFLSLFVWLFLVNRFFPQHGIPTTGRRVRRRTGPHSYGSFGGGGFSGGFGGFGGGFSGGGGAGRGF